ncbi:MARVEL domain-containing protein 1-like [Clavelina lepadiformis]|uniref:MARVEL domain-containing protein 1-like n=1 Tax=Clavelina lepadiformis TaxID=159417 RepID=UPI0040430BE9
MADVNPAATTGRTSSVSFNLNYVTSIPGVLTILELVFGLICWALLASFPFSTFFAGFQFALFVTITSWLLTLILFVIYLFGLHANACSGAPWSIIDFGHNALWSLMYFIAACVIAAYADGFDTLIASAVFAFIVTAIYLIHTFISFKEWRGGFPWQQSSSGSSVNT